MKFYGSLILFFCFLLHVNAQILTLEENPNWINYLAVVEKNSKTAAEMNYQLKEGRVAIVKLFNNNEVSSEFKLVYDEFSNVKSLEIRFPTKTLRDEEIIDYELKYNKLGLKIEDKNNKYVYDNKNNLVQSFTKLYEESNGTKGTSTNYFYDKKRSLIRTEKTSFEKGVKFIDVEEFVYDDCNNVRQIKRSSIPERNYPIVILGGENKNEIDFYEYEYNSDCIWLKKYLISDDLKILLFERELIK